MFAQVSNRIKGLLMVITGATLWGLSGTAAQVLFQEKQITAEWLVVVRMIMAGSALLLFAACKRMAILSIWANAKSIVSLLLFGFFGMLGVQYTYFASIATGNAATATLLQYLAPVYIVLYVMVAQKHRPTKEVALAIVLALLGTFLLITNGSTGELKVPFISVFWGVLSGVALAFYTLSSAQMLKKWHSILVVGWGMVIGGGGMCFVFPPFPLPEVRWDVETWLLIVFVVVFGTLFAFLLFIESIRYLSPTESSLLSSVEPLSAVVASIAFLHVPFGLFQAVGAACIMVTVLLLSPKKERQSSNSTSIT
ncbi:DMT family transporter [Saccharococcus thermophilus]|uniref:Drug/metabolite transporter (DMT)-like permease n=1 Tax=Saccharococcus thermophilus TaxID=29396 RepID=A0A846MG98_9BACL|nr:DMT family transporter [Saccharococcus thermophilus]NIK14763.1 drug/metabolite transporter (DMT)-like permease [Saccharococcus thermophilus]